MLDIEIYVYVSLKFLTVCTEGVALVFSHKNEIWPLHTSFKIR